MGVQEIKADNKKFHQLVEDAQANTDDPAGFSVTDKLTAGILLYNDMIDRNRRCLFAYLVHRLELIEGMRWEVGHMVPPDKLQKLHETEKQYAYLYNECLDKYMKRYIETAKEPLDLTADAQAPEELNVTIRCYDGGSIDEIVTQDSGVLKLCKGWVHTAKRTDVEQLIRAGKVEHVKSLRSAAG